MGLPCSMDGKTASASGAQQTWGRRLQVGSRGRDQVTLGLVDHGKALGCIQIAGGCHCGFLSRGVK